MAKPKTTIFNTAKIIKYIALIAIVLLSLIMIMIPTIASLLLYAMIALLVVAVVASFISKYKTPVLQYTPVNPMESGAAIYPSEQREPRSHHSPTGHHTPSENRRARPGTWEADNHKNNHHHPFQ